MRNNYKIILILVLMLLGSGITRSQDDFKEKIEGIKLEKLTKKLDLDETTKTSFIDKYKSFSRKMRELNISRAKTYKLMTENIESGDGLDTIVNKILDIESQINDKREEFINDMKQMLTAQQMAKMIIFERKFNNEIRKLLKQYQKDNKKDQIFKEDD